MPDDQPAGLRELFLAALQSQLQRADPYSPRDFMRDVPDVYTDPTGFLPRDVRGVTPSRPTTWREALQDVLRGGASDLPAPPIRPARFRADTLAPVQVPGTPDPWRDVTRAWPEAEGLVHQIRYDGTLPEDRLAEYDSVTNTIALRPELDTDPRTPTILAHELAHALGYSDYADPTAAYGTNAVVNAIADAAQRELPQRPRASGRARAAVLRETSGRRGR